MFKVSPDQLKRVVDAALETSVETDLGELGLSKNIINGIRTNIENGLKGDDLQSRKNHFGSNKRPDLEPMSICKAFCATLFVKLNQNKKISWLFFISLSTFAFLLRCASTNWQYTNEWIESIVISTLIWCNLILSMLQLKSNDNQVKTQLNMMEQQKIVQVVRQGQKTELVAAELVVGDIVVLEEGDELFTDGLVIESTDLFLDESQITGVNQPQDKSSVEPKGTLPIIPSKNIVLGGTKVISGQGKYIVLTVGQYVQINTIMKLEVTNPEQGGFLQVQTIDVQKRIQTFGFIGSVLVIFMLIGRYMISYHDVSGFITFSNILNLIIVMLSANASQALSIHFTHQLSQTVTSLLICNNLVRSLKCLEFLPFMNKLIVDKTGTLTQNKMTFELFWNENTTEMNYLKFSQFPKDYQQAFIQCCLVNNSCYNNYENGSNIEKELNNHLKEWGGKCDDKVTFHIPFNSARKTTTTILNQKRLVVRGESSRILDASTHFYSLIQGIVEIEKNEKANIENSLEQLNQGSRVTAIAYRDVDTSKLDLQNLVDKNEFDLDKKNLTFLGFLVFTDPIKQSALQAVSQLQSAGIKVIMATGDNAITARSVAIKCQIFDTQSKIVDGYTFSKECLSGNTEFASEIDLISVVNRARPEDKYNLIKQLQQNGNVVGCCGEGTNDAPALSKADIGFAFGIAGTELARSSSDIILLDDNIQSLVAAVIYGRNLLDSVKKFAQYQISSHFALIIILIASSAVGDTVLSPLQFIWVNLITDLFATFALSNPAPNYSLIQRKIHKKNESLLDNILFFHIGILSIYQIVVCLLLVSKSIMVFNTFVLVTLFNLINSRMISLELNVFKGFFTSWMIFASLFFIALLQYIIIQYGGTIMSTFDGLTYKEWGICVGLGVGALIWRLVGVLIIRPFLVSCHFLIE